MRLEIRQPQFPATGVPRITGTPEVGRTLRVDTSPIVEVNGLSDPDWLFDWIRDTCGDGEPAIGNLGGRRR